MVSERICGEPRVIGAPADSGPSERADIVMKAGRMYL